MTITRRNRDNLIDVREQRLYHCSKMEMREAQDNSDEYILTGYASTFQQYEMYGGPANGMGWVEQLDRKAFDRTLRENPDLHLLINHEGMPLARTKSGTLKLSVDDGGLKVEARLDRSDPDVQRLEPKMRRGDMDEMSFAFRVKAQEWKSHPDFPDDDQSLRIIREASLHKGDVSVVNFGANPTTHAEIKGISDMLKVIADADISELAEVRADTDLIRAVVEKLTPGKESRETRPPEKTDESAKDDEMRVKVSDAPWSIWTQSDFTLEQWRASCLLDTEEGASDRKERYRLPVREPNGTLNRNGIRAMAFKIQTMEDLSDEQRSAMARKVVGLYRAMREDVPEYLNEIANENPDDNFFDPEHGTPLRDALVPPTKRGMSLREAQQRMGILPKDGERLTLAEATGQANSGNRAQ
jgi:HK97 family phage prohead protease